MAPAEQFFVIILDSSSASERNSVHARVKKFSTAWWHNDIEVWIVRGGGTQASDWSNRLRTAMANGPSSMLVLELPQNESRSWAYFGPNPSARTAWLHTTYTKDRR
jgi:hypothetical protein